MRYITQYCLAISITALVVASIAAADSPSTMPSTMPTTAPTVLTWDQAKDHIGELATVTGKVMGTHDFGGAAVLNIGKDFPDPTRFTVYIPEEDREGLPADLDQGKTISVTGTIKSFHDVPEVVGAASNITVVGESTTTPSTQP